VCTPTINNIFVNRTLIDGGVGLNIIFVEVIEKMQVPYHRLMPYNTILGYPALAKFMAVPHHSFNVLKILSANDMITMRCNEKDALRSVVHDYREAATMFPADEDLLEHSGDLVRKKQLVSQERAAAKKAALQLFSPGSSKKGPSASPSAKASEDLVHPMLDMSIGEAATPSGRRPQFT
jgi:hypothetical protein